MARFMCAYQYELQVSSSRRFYHAQYAAEYLFEARKSEI